MSNVNSLGRFKVGQVWETRDGDKYRITAIDPADRWPVSASYISSNNYTSDTKAERSVTARCICYDRRGYFWRPSQPCNSDLIHLVSEAHEPKKPEIKVGQVWKARNGSQWCIKEIHPTIHNYPVKAKSLTPCDLFSTEFYTKQGEWRLNQPNHDLDLVELISEAPAPAPEPKKPEIKVGQVWKTRHGAIATIVSVNTVRFFIDPYPVRVSVLGCTKSYTKDGYSYQGDESNYDLVELISEAPEPKKPEIKVGQVWKARNGSRWRIKEIKNWQLGETRYPVTAEALTVCDRDCNNYGEYWDATELYTSKGQWYVLSPNHYLDLVELFYEAPEPKKPEIKVGQVWRTRYGLHARIINIDPPLVSNYPIVAKVDGEPKSGVAYSKDGKYYLVNVDHRLDLVELISEAPEPAPKKVQPKSGEAWVTRDGRICVVRNHPGISNMFPIVTNLSGYHAYREDGSSCLTSQGVPCKYDLVNRVDNLSWEDLQLTLTADI